MNTQEAYDFGMKLALSQAGLDKEAFFGKAKKLMQGAKKIMNAPKAVKKTTKEIKSMKQLGQQDMPAATQKMYGVTPKPSADVESTASKYLKQLQSARAT